MALSSGQRLELLHIAGENATKLLEALQREVSTVRGFSEGERVFNNVIDAASDTLDNLNQALRSGAPPE
jgi:hypothetical protein